MTKITDLSQYDEYLSLTEAAELEHVTVSRWTLARWVREGHLPAIKRGNRGYFIHPDDLAEALVQPVGTDRIDEAVREVVARAPRLTPEQVATINDALAASATREGDVA